MSEHNPRYPEDTPLSVGAFCKSDFNQATSGIEPTYTALSGALTGLAKAASEAQKYEAARVWWLLADLCMMMLDTANRNEPFRPYLLIGDRHSMSPASMVDEDYLFFKDLVESLPEGLLKARVSDLLWITPGFKHIRHARAAIDGYATVPLNDEIWYQEGRECFQRALSLTKMIGRGDEGRLSNLTQAIMDAIDQAIHQELPFAVGLVETVMDYQLEHPEVSALPEKVAELGRCFVSKQDIFRARQCFDTACKGFALFKRHLQAAKMTVAIAETWVSEAEVRGEQTHPIVAQNALENALQTYRSVPGAYRPELDVDKVLPVLRQRIAEAGARVVEQMSLITTRTDITKLVKRTKRLIEGQSFGTALYHLANMYPFCWPAESRQGALKSLRTGIVSSLTEAVFFDETGRVIAKRPPLSFGTELTEEDEYTVQAKMVSEHLHTIRLTVRGGVLPALAIISEAHCVKEVDMVELAKASSLVPPNRVHMVGKGLYWGFVGDFGMAAHFLIPQMEALIRHRMKEAGLNTSTSSADGIVTENGLSTLMDVEGVSELLGDDVAFEIRAVFCSPYGPNLRNTFAHGLLDDDQIYAESIVYAWWFMLKYISGPFWETVPRT
ncbi:DUF4209 domain-containing protein [Pseudomonas monteilii]|uniref:DUF4209 domain-containing protein n=1 Tax=Pseudomonas monteilii TaxID=76759 RepID=UPI001E33626E|nr:DUF4209 domain-containing protein [Pseudomonas monteilii]MCE0877168.1 DUF4209 domain-containing protein [Pseudomonas monteilii]MCE0929324.1 DUF4209 domain-containing protein [Pseudomonas monteilii]MCE0935071.1 DUF4209 domain-containing protein [Pseudomonas monteilii]MCE1015598.1 DUF4209 domain-containing protein [Pseudomonas monteilii]MCE1044295.1 DUF4209 domain-containing protein [Pseudomonas monteilii]